MTSKFWFESYKYSAVVSTIFGLLLPGLPLLAAPSGSVEIFSSATLRDPQNLRWGGCEGSIIIREFLTDTFNIFICQDEEGNIFYQQIKRDSGEIDFTVYGVSTTDFGDYTVTTYDDEGNKYQYYVGPFSFTIYLNDSLFFYEEIG